MKTFQIIFIIVAGIGLVISLSITLIRKINIRRKNQIKLIIKKGNVINCLNLLFGFSFIGIGLWYSKSEKDILYQNILWIILGISSLTHLLNAGYYVIIDSNGIKDSGFLKWDEISSVSKNEFNPNEIVFKSEKKILEIDFYSKDKIDEFKSIIKQIRPDIFEKYLNGI